MMTNMNCIMKNILKAAGAALATLAIMTSCVGEKPFDEITELTLARCLEPQNLSAKVDVNTGDHVTFGWDVNKDAGAFSLVVYTDETLKTKAISQTVQPSEVPYTVRLAADNQYWFTVQAYRVDDEGLKVEGSESKIAVYDGHATTYAVKDNLFLEITGRTENSVSFAWSKDLQDYKEVTHISATPVKGGDALKLDLTDAQKAAAAATVSGLKASTEYQFVLYYMSASRGAVDAWTMAAPGTMTQVSTSEALVANVTSGGEIYLKLSGSPYTLGGSKPTAGVHIVGEMDGDGNRPVIIGNFDVSSICAGETSIICENVIFDDQANHNHLVNYSGGATTLGDVKFINCGITGFKAGLFYNNKTGNDDKLTVGDIVFDSCDIYDMAAAMAGDCVDFRKNTHSTVKSIQFVNNTVWDGIRTFFRLGDQAGEDLTITNGVKFENNTVKAVSVVDNGNNRGIFAVRVPVEMSLKKNIFLYVDGGKTAEDVEDYAQLFQNKGETVIPTLTASDNYAFACGKDFFKKQDAAGAGFTVLTADPCYNSKGNFFQLSNQDLISKKVGASKWWISYVEKEEDLTQNVLAGAHTWNLQDATLFAGEVKNSRVRDELMLVGTEATPLNADGGINFLGASVLTRKGVPTEGYISFKVKTAGSVNLEVANGGSSSVVVAVQDDNGFAVKGGAMASAGAGVQKVLVPAVSGEATVYLFATGAISLKKLAWSLDTAGGNKVLSAPKPVAEPVTLTEGDATDITFTWDAIPNAGSYLVSFNKKAAVSQTELSFTVPGDEIAQLKAGLYGFTVQAVPSDIDIYYVKSETGTASVAIQPKGGAGEVVEVTKVWDFSGADWQAAFAECGAAGADITNWDITVDGLSFWSKTKSKYNTTYMQFGGAGVNATTGDYDRCFRFTAPEQGTLKITVSNTGSTEALDRTVRVIVGNESEDKPGGFASTAPQTIEFSIKAGEVIITAPVNGLRFYKIEYNYTTGPAAAIEYDWNFSNADWQAAFAEYGAAGSDILNWDVTVDGLTFFSSNKSKYAATYMQFGGGSGDPVTRYFKFTAPDQGTLKITVSNTGSSEALDRTVRVTVGDEYEDKPGGFASTAPQEIEFSIKAGEVIITAPVNGLRFYRIYYTNK